MNPSPWLGENAREACEEKCSMCWVYRTKVRVYFDKILPKTQEKLHWRGGESKERRLDNYWGRFEAINFCEENLLSRLTNKYLVNI